MLPSLALIILVGLALAALCQTIRLPRIIGMLFTGILLGPYVLNLLDDSILGISADLRQIALLIILLKAGLSLNLTDLKKVGRPAVLMSCLPASCEILAFLLFAPALLGTPLNRKERLFCVIAYLPKATVQAAIGSVPLALGLPCGQLVLSVAVLAILITAPLGALGMDLTYRKLLSKA
ncbi:cation:proton antiporter [Subdoligranulum variabile]|uniref:cation:proton antiporter domain-containing protein n=1 Tax=Subdoligranulum variabile TaxID=214851 RepID=UPI0026F04E16|nr:cation:proton antiporter [Subdoligranulum variabile]